MGLLDNILQKKEDSKETQKEEQIPEGKYSEPCAACGNPGTEKKWAGKYWHKKCLRQMRKSAKGMM